MTATAPEIQLHDPTLRDGHHAVGHQLTREQLSAYAAAADSAGVPVIEVGHGNGLGASSLQTGLAKLADTEMLDAVRAVLTSARMGVFMGPGWGTGDDLRLAVSHGVQVVRLAAHCTEADVTERHLGLLAEWGVEAHGVLLMSHMATPAQLAEQCALMATYGAQAVGIYDSAGHYLPQDVAERITEITEAVDVPVIFHGHNNLTMATANSVAAVEAGARIIDACARGFGAGAGNTQIEALVPVLERLGYSTGIDQHALFAAADLAEQQLMKTPPFTDSVAVMSGLSGVFSGFKNRVLAVAAREGVHPGDLFAELGRRQAVAGQEDLIPEAAAHLKERTMTDQQQPAPAIHPRLHDLLVRELRIEPGSLNPASTLAAIGLDSLAEVELAVLLSEEFGTPVTEDQITGLHTLENLNRFFIATSQKG